MDGEVPTADDRLRRDAMTLELLSLRAASADPLERDRLLKNAVELNLWIAARIAAVFRGREIGDDDLWQVAALGLVKAARRFRPAVNESFVAYAVPTVFGELKKCFRDNTWPVRIPRRLQETAAPIQVVPVHKLVDLPDEDFAAALERFEAGDVVRSVLDRLDARSRAILVLRFAEERVQADIGRLVGLSQVQVSREIPRILRQARGYLAEAF